MHFQLERTLRKARAIAGSGQPIPLDLAADLMAQGVDVDAIERNPHGEEA